MLYCVAVASCSNSVLTILIFVTVLRRCSSLFRPPVKCAECPSRSRCGSGGREQQRPRAQEAATEQRGERLSPQSICAQHQRSQQSKAAFRTECVMYQRWVCWLLLQIRMLCDLLRYNIRLFWSLLTRYDRYLSSGLNFTELKGYFIRWLFCYYCHVETIYFACQNKEGKRSHIGLLIFLFLIVAILFFPPRLVNA